MTKKPQIIQRKSKMIIRLMTSKQECHTKDIQMVLDLMKNDLEIVGIEIINLKSKTNCKKIALSNYEGSINNVEWKIQYDDINDILYVGFRKQKPKTGDIFSQPATGKITISKDGTVIGFEVYKT